VYLTSTAVSSLRAKASAQQGNLTVSLFFYLALLLTLGAATADQFLAPLLYSSSPLWAVALCGALVWRKKHAGFGFLAETSSWDFSLLRLLLFAAAHLLLVGAAMALRARIAPLAGTSSSGGWLVAAWKLAVLAPTLLLLPMRRWREVFRRYAAECIAGLVVLLTFFPERLVTAIWPWYGEVLGTCVFRLAGLFVPGLTYVPSLTPTIQGPHLDLTVLLACSGISGMALFDCLFALMAILDWNRLRKGRTLAAYFGGVAVMLLGNALRITFLIVFGNRGFADSVAQYHISAGWLFFAVTFLSYLALTYRFLLVKPVPVSE